MVVAVVLLTPAAELRAQPEEHLDSLEQLLEKGASDEMASPPAPTAVLRVDTSRVERRVPSAALLSRYREDDDFDYGSAYREPESLFDALWRAITNWFRDLLGADGVVTFWDIVFYTLLGAALIFVTLKLIGADTRGLFFGAKRDSGDGVTLLEEDIHGIDFEAQIERARSSGDLRSAVRLHYLRLLRNLTDAGAIAWRAEKTDADYARELRDTSLHAGFERAALLYEYVWYGDFPIDVASYQKIAAVVDAVAVRQ